MYFNSIAYIFGFLPVVIIVYFTLNKWKLIKVGKIWLILASLFFYGWFNIKYTPFLILYALINFAFYSLIKKYRDENDKKSLKVLICGVLSNILILAFFKYCNFFVDGINEVFQSSFSYIKLLMPLALSFQTLQQIGFLVDSYKNKEINYGFVDYFLFTVFFPQMVVGPIVKYSETIPQFNNLRRKIFSHKNFIIGLAIFLIGFYKKGFLVGPLNDTIFDKIPLIQYMSTVECWMFCIMEYFHAYLDMSSYIDMALGSALMLNIELPINFNSPMFAQNIVDFWKRWQMTFSRFMKKYVYEPLKSLSPKEWITDVSIMVTCFLGGMWQGAGICAVVWGCFHGLGFLINKYWQKLNIKMPSFVALVVTFVFVAIVGCLLRVQTLSQMGDLIKHLVVYLGFDGTFVNSSTVNFYSFDTERMWSVSSLVICGIGILLTLFKVSIEGKDLARFIKPNMIWAFILSIAIIELIYFYAPPTGFLYYNF